MYNVFLLYCNLLQYDILFNSEVVKNVNMLNNKINYAPIVSDNIRFVLKLQHTFAVREQCKLL